MRIFELFRSFNKLLERFNIRITKRSTYLRLLEDQGAKNDVRFLRQLESKQRSICIDNLEFSKAQLRQDLFVLSELDFKRNGFFVEFGATNGVDLSNTIMLEKHFGWHGILAEPARGWLKDLSANRTSHIEPSCVWSESGKTLLFNETSNKELSTLESFSEGDRHGPFRKSGERYRVETISLEDLLKKFDAPHIIDYISLDTEGSEYEILRNFDFSLYKFRVISCEHNYSSNREKVQKLLTGLGYQRKFTEVSQFDDWYVLTS